MVLRWIVNAGLLAIPIGGTIGALLGIEAHRQATGQAPLFAGGGNDGGSGSGFGSGGGSTGSSGNTGEHTTNNGVTHSRYCKQSIGIPPGSLGEQFICESEESLKAHVVLLTDCPSAVNPNQWGVTSSTVGGLCMNVRQSKLRG